MERSSRSAYVAGDDGEAARRGEGRGVAHGSRLGADEGGALLPYEDRGGGGRGHGGHARNRPPCKAQLMPRGHELGVRLLPRLLRLRRAHRSPPSPSGSPRAPPSPERVRRPRRCGGRRRRRSRGRGARPAPGSRTSRSTGRTRSGASAAAAVMRIIGWVVYVLRFRSADGSVQTVWTVRPSPRREECGADDPAAPRHDVRVHVGVPQAPPPGRCVRPPRRGPCPGDRHEQAGPEGDLERPEAQSDHQVQSANHCRSR